MKDVDSDFRLTSEQTAWMLEQYNFQMGLYVSVVRTLVTELIKGKSVNTGERITHERRPMRWVPHYLTSTTLVARMPDANADAVLDALSAVGYLEKHELPGLITGAWLIGKRELLVTKFQYWAYGCEMVAPQFQWDGSTNGPVLCSVQMFEQGFARGARPWFMGYRLVGEGFRIAQRLFLAKPGGPKQHPLQLTWDNADQQFIPVSQLIRRQDFAPLGLDALRERLNSEQNSAIRFMCNGRRRKIHLYDAMRHKEYLLGMKPSTSEDSEGTDPTPSDIARQTALLRQAR